MKRGLVVGARQAFVDFEVSNARIFRRQLERNGSFMLIKRHLSRAFIDKIDGGSFDELNASLIGDRCHLARAYADEIDRLSAK